MSTIGTSVFTKEELYRMNNNSSYGFNWIDLSQVNHINEKSKIIKYKLYPTGYIKNMNIGREYIALQEDKVLTYNEKNRYNII